MGAKNGVQLSTRKYKDIYKIINSLFSACLWGGKKGKEACGSCAVLLPDLSFEMEQGRTQKKTRGAKLAILMLSGLEVLG